MISMTEWHLQFMNYQRVLIRLASMNSPRETNLLIVILYVTRTLIVDSDTARERESLRNAKEPAAEQKFIVHMTRGHQSMPPNIEETAAPSGGAAGPPYRGRQNAT